MNYSFKKLQFDKEDLEKLVALKKLIDYGAGKLTNTSINRSKLSAKQDILLLTFAPVNSYAESIVVLCESFRPDAAKVILRTLVEVYINIAYLLSHNSNNRIWKFIVEESFYSFGLMDQAINFYNKYPKLRPKKPEYKTSALIKLRDIPEKKLQSYAQKLKLKLSSKKNFKKDNPEVFDLLKRALALDRKNKKGTFEYWYLMVYRYFSEYTHLSLKGITHFFRPKSYGFDVDIGQSKKDIGIIIVTTYHVYLFFLEKLKQYELLSLKLKPFAKSYEEMNKKLKW